MPLIDAQMACFGINKKGDITQLKLIYLKKLIQRLDKRILRDYIRKNINNNRKIKT
jgi:hypothetical protein